MSGFVMISWGKNLLEMAAEVIWKESQDDPLQAAHMIVLTPNHAAAMALRNLLKRRLQSLSHTTKPTLTDSSPIHDRGDQVIILPQILSLGEVSPDQPEQLTEKAESLITDPINEDLVFPQSEHGDQPRTEPRKLESVPVRALTRELVMGDRIQRWYRNQKTQPSQEPTPQQILGMTKRFIQILNTRARNGYSSKPLDGALHEIARTHDLSDHFAEIRTLLTELDRHWRVWKQNQDVPLSDSNDLQYESLLALSRHWRTSPPDRKILAVGSSGSNRATAELLRTIATLENGVVLIPEIMPELLWEEKTCPLADDHPLARLYQLTRDAPVRPILFSEGASSPFTPADSPTPPSYQEPSSKTCAWKRRRELMRQTFSPLNETLSSNAISPGIVDGLSTVACRNEHEEARMAALILLDRWRQGRSVAYVAVSATATHLIREWLHRYTRSEESQPESPLIIDTIGHSLASESAGLLVAALLDSVVNPSWVNLWTCIAHPLTNLPLINQEVRALLERHVFTVETRSRKTWRIPPTSWTQAQEIWQQHDSQLPCEEHHRIQAILASAHQALAPLSSLIEDPKDSPNLGIERHPLITWLHAHHRSWKQWCGISDEDMCLVSSAQKVDQLFSQLIRNCQLASQHNTPLDGSAGPRESQHPPQHGDESRILLLSAADYATVFADALARTSTARHRPQEDPRKEISLIGRFEARLLRFDTVVVGQCVEGTWPLEEKDPWLPEALHETLGLDSHAQRAGMQALDLLSILANPEVVLLFPKQQQGSPTLPSRWWQRMTFAAKRLNISFDSQLTTNAQRASDQIDWHWHAPTPAPQPAPRRPLEIAFPPVSVTQTETLRTNPFAFFVQSILHLRSRQQHFDVRDLALRGTVFHHLIEGVVAKHPTALPDTNNRLASLIQTECRDLLKRLAITDLVAEFFWTEFIESRTQDLCTALREIYAQIPDGGQIVTEVAKNRVIDGTQVRGRADLIVLHASNCDPPAGDPKVRLIADIKTGSRQLYGLPKLQRGFLWQLPLICELFEVSPTDQTDMAYLILDGKHPLIHSTLFNQDIQSQVLGDFRELIDRHSQPESRFTAWPDGIKTGFLDPQIAHLARLSEWSHQRTRT